MYVHEGPSAFFFVLVCSDILASLLLETVLISLGTKMILYEVNSLLRSWPVTTRLVFLYMNKRESPTLFCEI